MNASLVGILLAVLFGLIVVVSFLIGLKRGLMKSLFRFAWLLISGLIIWFVTPPIASYLNTFDLTSLGIVIDGQTVHKLSDVGVNLLNSLGLDEAITSSSSVQSFAQNLPTMILNVLLFVVLFFVFKYLLWIVWAPIASRIFDKDKRAKKVYNKKIKELKKKGMPITEEDAKFSLPKKNKFRFLGGLVGVVSGLLVCAVAFSPIVGLNAIYQNVSANVMTTNDKGEEVSFVNSQLDEETIEYANVYQNSIAFSLMKYTGMNFMAGVMFDNMAVAKVEDKTVKLADEVSTGVKLYSRYIEIDDFIKNYDTATKEDLNKVLANVKEVFFDMENSQLIYVLGDDLMPIFIDKYVIENEDFNLEFNGIEFDEILRVAYKEATKNNPLKVRELQKQVESLVDIVQLFNNYDLALPIIKGEVSDFDGFVRLVSQNVVGDNVNSAKVFSDALVDKLYGISLLEGQYPTIIDSTAEGLFKNLGVEFESNKDIDKNVLKDKLKIIFANTFEFFKYLDESTDLDFGANTKNALSSLGKIIDCVGVKANSASGILSKTSYNNLIDFLKSKANEFLADIGDLSSVTERISLVSVESNWETELGSLSPLYKSIIKIKNNTDDPISIEKVMDGSYDLKTTGIGGALQDILGDGVTQESKSVVLTNESMRGILSALFDKIDDGDEIKKYLNIKVGAKPTGEDNRPTIKQNMLDAIYDKNAKISLVTNWEKELYDLVDVFVSLNNNIFKNSSDLSVLAGTDNTGLKDLGATLDKAILDDTKLFVSSENIRALIEYFIDNQNFAEDSEIYKILNSVKVGDEPEVEWEDNRLSVKESILNNIYNYTTQKSQINPTAPNNPTFWADELENLKSAFDGSLKNADDFKTSGAKIGKVLDNIYSSKIFSRNVVKSIVKHYLDEETKTLDFVLYFNDLKKNHKEEYNSNIDPIAVMKNIINLDNPRIIYETEIANLLDLVDILNGNYTISDAGKSDEWNKYDALGAKFDNLANNRDSDFDSKLITKKVINCFIGYYLRSDKFDTGNASLNNAISSIPGENNANLDEIVSYRTQFNDMIDLSELIKKSTTTFKEIGDNLDLIKQRSIIKFALKDILNYYIDDYVPTDKEWNKADDYKVTTEIKKNVANINISAKNESELGENEVLLRDVEFGREFTYINDFKDRANSITLDTIGGFLNKLVGKKPVTDGGEIYYASKLLNKPVITIIISSVMREKIESLNRISTGAKNILKGTTTPDGQTIKLGLADNVGLIEDYELEFEYLNSLIDLVNTDSVDTNGLAEKLDEISGKVAGQEEIDETKKSKLFTNEMLVDLVRFYFDNQVTAYVENYDEASNNYLVIKNADYAGTILSIRQAINAKTSFGTLFSELTTLKSNIDKLSTIKSATDFATADTNEIGTILDGIEAMTAINGGNTAKEMTKTLTNILANSGETEAEKQASKARVDAVLTDERIDFENHEKSSENPNYYSSLITALKTAFTTTP